MISKKIFLNLLFFMLCFVGKNANAQGQEDHRFLCGLTGENMKPLYQKVAENISTLQQQGLVQVQAKPSGATAAATTVRFAWPLKTTRPNQYPYYSIGNFTDLDSTAGVLDYMGGERSYDGHHGIDIGVGSYSWEKKRSGEVEVIAAAPGILVEKHDDEVDGNCSWDTWQGSTGRGNHAVILHQDGSTVSYYMHLKKGSVTTKSIGSQIHTGDYLGTVASSGRSTGPHLHFQVNVGWNHPDTGKGTFVEPFAGPENYTTDESLWIDQKNYEEPAIMAMETHRATYGNLPDYYLSSCDSTVDLSTLDNHFLVENQSISYRTFFRDYVPGQTMVSVVSRPDGAAAHLWTYDNPNNYRSGYHVRQFDIGADPMQGTWAYYVTFNNKTYAHYFTVGCINNYTLSGTQVSNKGYIAGNAITSTAIIPGNANNNIEYRADNQVTLLPGFTATAGSTFLANTRGCVRGNQF